MYQVAGSVEREEGWEGMAGLRSLRSRDPSFGIENKKPSTHFVRGAFFVPLLFQTSLSRKGTKKASQLSLQGFLLSGWQDSNLRPPAPKADFDYLCYYCFLLRFFVFLHYC